MKALITAYVLGALAHAVWTWAEWGRPGSRGLSAYWADRHKAIIGATVADGVLGVLYVGGYLTPILQGALSQLGFQGEIPVDPAMAVLAGFLSDSVGKKALGAFVATRSVPVLLLCLLPLTAACGDDNTFITHRKAIDCPPGNSRSEPRKCMTEDGRCVVVPYDWDEDWGEPQDARECR